MDAFEQAVARARDQLSATEGGTVSWREIVRRAGFEDGDFGRVSYHLLPRSRSRPHHVPTWLIDALDGVLPIPRAELVRAAAEAAGYRLDAEPDHHAAAARLVPLVLQVLDDDTLDQAERDRIGLEVIAVITAAMQRERPPARLLPPVPVPSRTKARSNHAQRDVPHRGHR